jgi:hypothetical protein
VALLNDPSAFDLLRRKDDLFEDGVATIFGIRQGQADLYAFCFRASGFTAEQARRWLRERGLGSVRCTEATGARSER